MNKGYLTSDFPGPAAGHGVFDFATEAEVTRRANAYEMNRRAYFESQNWRLAIYALDLLLETTKGKFRRNGTTPEWIHSARPTEWPESLIKAGLLDRAAVEKKYGSLEIAIVNWLLHDLGENEGITSAFIAEYFEQRLIRDADHRYSEAQYKADQSLILYITNDFKLLTNGKNGDIPFNGYLNNISTSGYAFLAKLGDRLDNMATLVGLNRPQWETLWPSGLPEIDYDGNKEIAKNYFDRIQRYNWHTYENFALHDLVGIACQKHPLLSKAFHGMDCEMGFLFRINAAYVSFHPYNPKNGAFENKRLILDPLVVDVSKYWAQAVSAGAGMHHGNNPKEMLWRRIGDEAKEAGIPGLAFKLQTEPYDRGLRKPYLYEQAASLLTWGKSSLHL